MGPDTQYGYDKTLTFQATPTLNMSFLVIMSCFVKSPWDRVISKATYIVILENSSVYFAYFMKR